MSDSLLDNRNQKDDEVRLIDFFIVVLRWRMLVLLCVGFALMVAGVTFFVSGIGQTEISVHTSSATYIINGQAEFYSINNPLAYSALLASDPAMLARATITSGNSRIWGAELDELSPDDQSLYLSKNVLNKPDATSVPYWGIAQSNAALKVTIKTLEPVDINKFFAAHLAELNSGIYDWYRGIAENDILKFKELEPLFSLENKGSATFIDLYQKNLRAQALVDGKFDALMLASHPVSTLETSRSSTMVLIIKRMVINTAVGLGVGIFLAFVANWISLLKKDEKVLQRIRSAINRKS